MRYSPIQKQELELDHTPVSFGKYKGQTPDEISEHDPGYVVWMYRNVKPIPCSVWLKDVCADEMHNARDTESDPEEL